MNEDCVEKNLNPYLLYFPKNKLSKSVTVGSGRTGSGRAGSGRAGSSLQMIQLVLKFLELYFNFSAFLKVLKLFECWWGDPYMTANKKFIRLAHSKLPWFLFFSLESSIQSSRRTSGHTIPELKASSFDVHNMSKTYKENRWK